MPLVRRHRCGRHKGRFAVLLRHLTFLIALAYCGRYGLAAEPIDFGRQVQPILSGHCFTCHGPDAKSRQADLRLDLRTAATADRDGAPAIRPGDPKSSEMVRRITASDPDERMPPSTAARSLSAAEIEVLVRWVQEGAPYAAHWSYRKPVRPPIPSTRDSAWARNAVDRFVLARLEREGLKPSPEADRPTLARRAALAITGLPLGVEQCDAFLSDRSPEAYERLVDRLLAEPSYGEHWGRLWLDVARYADSVGYVSDEPRPIWAYRDYVIRAFNANRPFDQFTIEQIAGDLLSQPTEDQIVATAFHRNTPTNTEGGTDDEEFRNLAVVDRVNTTMAAWMGTTMACAQCHTHKYDPITQEEYFRFFAFFNNTEDADKPGDAPLYSFYTEQQKRQRAEIEGEMAALKKQSKPNDPANATRAEALAKRLAAIQPLTVPIMRELPPERWRKTQIQYRGNFLDRGPEVTPGVPAAFHPLPIESQKSNAIRPTSGRPVFPARTTAGHGTAFLIAHQGAPPNRLTLARWLIDDDNPLTARVIVNRYWENLFGMGLVATSDDFGTQGDRPSHPELLDWLATELVASHWDLKRLVRLLVTSATYRQSARVTPELLQRDPDNRLLARGPRFRVDAEVVRDQALFSAGLLSRKMFGPPVRPLQPSFGLSAAFGPAMDWQTSEGEDRYRRGVYTNWRRTNPYPSMTTLDAPSRELCTLRRTRTNTPLQALVTLNDPVYVEAAQALARQLLQQPGTPADRARRGFRRVLLRQPGDAELARLVRVYDQANEKLKAAPDLARQLATEPLGPAPAGTAVAELAAWTVVANVLLNLDETFLPR